MELFESLVLCWTVWIWKLSGPRFRSKERVSSLGSTDCDVLNEKKIPHMAALGYEGAEEEGWENGGGVVVQKIICGYRRNDDPEEMVCDAVVIITSTTTTSTFLPYILRS